MGPIEVLLLLLSMGVWLWALVDCLWHESARGTAKLIWIIVIVFMPVIGALLYLLIRRPYRMVEVSQ